MTSKEAFEKFRNGYESDQDRKPTAFETWQAAIEYYKASLVPVGEVSGNDYSMGLLYEDCEPGTPLCVLGETKMNITVEFLLTHESEIYDVGRIPCIGEHVILNDEEHEVKAVMHILDSLTAIKAIVRVK